MNTCVDRQIEGLQDCLPRTTPRQYPRQAFVYRGGNPASLYYLESGMIQVRYAGAGTPTGLLHVRFVGADEFFGDDILFGYSAPTEEALCLAPCSVMQWTAAAVWSKLREDPARMEALSRYVHARAIDYRRQAQKRGLKIPARLRQLLLDLNLQFHTVDLGTTFTHNLLAIAMGSTREIVSHEMRELRRQGAIVGGSRRWTLRPEVLAELQ